MSPLRWPWRRREPPPMPVVVGSGRCGSTLLRLMLDSHPQLAIPPETGFLPAVYERREDLGREAFADLVTGSPSWPDFHLDAGELRSELAAVEPFSATAAVRCFYRAYARRHGKPRWGDKTPGYGFHLPAIQALLPEARFVHLVRDGRDVALSLRRVWFAPAQDAAGLARYWRDCIEATRAGARGCDHYLEIRFEDLLREPEGVLRRVCDHLELRFSAAMLGYAARAAERLGEVTDRPLPDGRVITREQRLGQHPLLGKGPRLERVGRWREEMTADERATFAAVAGDLLADLGYPAG